MTERQSLRSELRENFYRPLWGTKKQSSASLDGVVRCFPSEAPVGPLTRPTGLSRAQQLMIFNTLKVILLPCFCHSQGGLALDGAVPIFGTRDWWTTLLVRVKAQKVLKNSGPRLCDKINGIRCGENYSLSLRSKARLGRRTSIKACIDTDDANHISKLLRRDLGDATGEHRRWDGIGGKIELAHRFDIYKLALSCSVREALQIQDGALVLPALISSEVVSNNLHSPIHYRLGLHQILDVLPDSPDVIHEANNGMYFQGGVGIDGVVTLFRSPRIKKRTKEDRLEQIRGVKFGDVTFNRPFSESRPGYESHYPNRPSKNSSHKILLPPSTKILESLKEQTISLKESASALSKATKDVKSGSLKSLKTNIAQGLFGGGKGFRGRALLPPAHIKVGGLAGVVASVGIRKDGIDRLSFPERGYASAASQHRANLRWKSSFDDHPVKAFVGCSLGAQIGRMKRRLLSFTSAIAECECTTPIPVLQPYIPRRIPSIGAASRRNLMIGNIPLRPLVNLSFTQQVIGPLRAKADFRVALESSSTMSSMPNLDAGNAFLRQIQSVRPSVVDAQYGMDYVIPGTQGAAKFCVWYSPYKKEAMAELRML